MAKMHLSLLVLAAAVGCCFLMDPAAAMIHIVGGAHGWRLPHNKTFFEQWAKPRTFGVGDKIVFPYRPGSNNVVVVNKEDFEVCGQKVVINMYYNGPTMLNLTETGDFYYYCGVGKHCEAGQKLHIKVVNGEGSAGSPFPFKLISKDVVAPTPAESTHDVTLISSAVSVIQNFSMVFGLLAFLILL